MQQPQCVRAAGAWCAQECVTLCDASAAAGGPCARLYYNIIIALSIHPGMIHAGGLRYAFCPIPSWSDKTAFIPALARHVMCKITHEALLYGILVRMPVHKHVTFVVFNFLIAWDLPMDLPADPGIRIRKEESETTIRMSCF